MVLRRLCEPARLCDIELSFGWERTRFSRLTRATIQFLYERWKHILYFDAERLTPEKLREFALAVAAKGAPLHNCCMMIDGRRCKCCRPVRNQRLLFNGWCRYCCLAYQAMTTPDGIHVHVFGPVEGRRHDQTLFKESGLPDILRRHFHDPTGGNLVVYGDPAYGISQHLLCPFKGNNLSRDEERFNSRMSRVRESVEWGFADVTRQWAYLKGHRQRILLEPVGIWYLVGTLLANAHSILYPNQISQFFACPPPTLDEYFHGDAVPDLPDLWVARDV